MCVHFTMRQNIKGCYFFMTIDIGKIKNVTVHSDALTNQEIRLQWTKVYTQDHITCPIGNSLRTSPTCMGKDACPDGNHVPCWWLPPHISE